MDDLAARVDRLPDAVRARILGAMGAASSSAAPPGAASAGTATSEWPTARGPAAGAAQPSVPTPTRPGAWVVDAFLTAEQLEAARADAQAALAEAQKEAAIGGEGHTVDRQARGDVVRWLRPDAEAAAGRQAMAELLRRLDGLRVQLERQGYELAPRPAYQLALYPGGGARYVRHADASLSCPSRRVTAIVYLNHPTEWDAQTHSGALALYNVPYTGPLGGAGVGRGEPATLLAPLGGRLVVFESHLFHEVLPAHAPRYAVTAWFHRRPPVTAAVAAAPRELAPPLQAGEQRDDGGDLAGPTPAPASTGGAAASTRAGAARVSDADAAAATPHETPVGTSTAAGSSEARAATAAAGGATAAASTSPCATSATADAGAASGPGSHPLRSAAQAAARSAPCASAPPATSAPAASPDVAAAATARIFVSVAAYRDPEAQWTLHSLLSNAERPERVRVGIVWQVDPVEDAAFVRVAGAKSHPEWLLQVRQVVVPHTEASGPCRARALAQTLWDGEEYVLQLDAHMRMVPGWDTLCIQQLAAAEALAPTGKAVLSAYPLGYSGEGAAAAVPDPATAPVTLLCGGGFDRNGFLRSVGRVLRARPPAPLPSCAWAAGLSFARSAWLQEVPYCAHLPHLFFGEEPYMLARMWSRGWDVYAPAVPLGFHQWERSARQHSYQRALAAAGADAAQARERSQQRVLCVLGGLSSSARTTATRPSEEACEGSAAVGARGAAAEAGEGKEEWPVGHVWGLGTARTLAQLAAAWGIDFAESQVAEAAKWGGLDASAFQTD